MAESTDEWVLCGCPEGTSRLDDGEDTWIQWQEKTHDAFSCECWNGSSLENCEPEWEDPGDPEDPPGDPGGPGGSPPPPPDSAFITMECPDSVVRGDPGGCTLVTSPNVTLETVEWEALVLDIPAPTQSGGSSFSGELVRNTQINVDVDLRVPGLGVQKFQDEGFITVVEREWDWQSQGGIHPPQSGTTHMDWPGGDAWGRVCRPGQACPGEIVQPHNNIANGNGYVRRTVPSGPNEGLHYILNVTMDLRMVAMVNPDLLPDGAWPNVSPAQYPATGSDAQACGAGAGDTVSVTFVAYNESCRHHQDYLVPFETWAWDHEGIHMANAITYVEEWQFPYFDPWARLEDIVSGQVSEVDTDAQERLEHIPECVLRAAATHGYVYPILDPFPGLSISVWRWAPSPGEFHELSQEYVWWTAGANPFSSPCIPS